MGSAPEWTRSARAWARCARPSCTVRHARGGRIFEAYRDGELEDDDEVAVIHGPARPATAVRGHGQHPRRLAAAERRGIIAGRPAMPLVRIAKELFYHDRTFERLLRRGRRALGRVPPVGAARLAAAGGWTGARGRVRDARGDASAAGRRGPSYAGRLKTLE